MGCGATDRRVQLVVASKDLPESFDRLGHSRLLAGIRKTRLHETLVISGSHNLRNRKFQVRMNEQLSNRFETTGW